MTEPEKIKKLLGLNGQQMEEMLLQDYMDWCLSQSYCQTYDVQNLMADASLSSFWLKTYLDALLDFLDHCLGMNPLPSPEEAAAILRIYKGKLHGIYNKGLLNKARTKKLISYEPN